jgi:hypothetical protein
MLKPERECYERFLLNERPKYIPMKHEDVARLLLLLFLCVPIWAFQHSITKLLEICIYNVKLYVLIKY